MKQHLILLLLFSTFIYANDTELEIYAQTKFQKDYSTLNKTQKEKIATAYEQMNKLSSHFKTKINENTKLQILSNMSNIQLYSQYYMAQYQPTDKELEILYKQLQPMKKMQVKLKRIVVKYKNSATKISKQLKQTPAAKRMQTFHKLLKKYSSDLQTYSHNGNLGWINQEQLSAKLSAKLQNLTTHDVLVYSEDNNIWQVFYIEQMQTQRKASFQEAKQSLISIAKKNALKREFQKILK